MDRVAQVFVAPFSKQQTLTYVDKFTASKDFNMDHWSAAQFEAALIANTDVAGLASSPLMLFMVLTILPSISDSAEVEVLHDGRMSPSRSDQAQAAVSSRQDKVARRLHDRHRRLICVCMNRQRQQPSPAAALAGVVAVCAWTPDSWRWRRWSS